MERNIYKIGKELFITSDKEIKEGDWILFQGILTKALKGEKFSGTEKIVLTTDQDLIADGVQAIDNEFLEWFVKNPSCEEVDIKNPLIANISDFCYKIIIPKEKPKQEALEEVAENYGWRIKTNTFTDPVKANDLASSAILDFTAGAKWQAERMYSEEEMLELLYERPNFINMTTTQKQEETKSWFEQNKKK
jgi:hypothetical protein